MSDRRRKRMSSRLTDNLLTRGFAASEIQAKNVFFRVFASAIGEIFVFSDDFKTAFLQHSYRADVVRCCPGENRPIYNKAEHPIERLNPLAAVVSLASWHKMRRTVHSCGERRIRKSQPC